MPRIGQIRADPVPEPDSCGIPWESEEVPLIAHPYTPERLLKWGKMRADAFCKANGLPHMAITPVDPEGWHFDACAYWRASTCTICLRYCGRPASEAQTRNWSWPGAVTDRTPYGVVCHELGHHADYWTGRAGGYPVGKYFSAYGESVRKATREKPITSYCPNDAEWFAEMFRLFVTNHALLFHVRPKTWGVLMERFVPVSDDDWQVCLGKGCPTRVLQRQLKR